MEIDSLLASLPPFLFQSLLFFFLLPFPLTNVKPLFRDRACNRSTCMCLEKGAGASSPHSWGIYLRLTSVLEENVRLQKSFHALYVSQHKSGRLLASYSPS